MKVLKYLIFLFLITTIGFSIYIAVQPNEFEISKTKTVKAPTPVIYNNIIDFKNWKNWWSATHLGLNPETKITLSQQTKGINGLYLWEAQDGIGKIETLDALINTSILQKMQFTSKPNFNIKWQFKANDNGTTDVTYSVFSKNLPFKFKALNIVKGNIENQIQSSIKNSLEALEENILESMAIYNIKIYGETEYGGGFFMFKTTRSTTDNRSNEKQKQFYQVRRYMNSKNIYASGRPFTIYNEINTEKDTIIMSQAIPIKDKIETGTQTPPEDDILCGYIPKTKAIKLILKGNYSNLPEAWKLAKNYITDNNFEQSDLPPFEIYTNDSNVLPNPADWITEIYIPVK